MLHSVCDKQVDYSKVPGDRSGQYLFIWWRSNGYWIGNLWARVRK